MNKEALYDSDRSYLCSCTVITMETIWRVLQVSILLVLCLQVLADSEAMCIDDIDDTITTTPTPNCQILMDDERFVIAAENGVAIISRRLDGTEGGGRKKRQAIGRPNPSPSPRPGFSNPPGPGGPGIPVVPAFPVSGRPDVTGRPDMTDETGHPFFPGIPDQPTRPTTPTSPRPDVTGETGHPFFPGIGLPDQPTRPTTPTSPRPDGTVEPGHPFFPGIPGEADRPTRPTRPTRPEGPQRPYPTRPAWIPDVDPSTAPGRPDLGFGSPIIRPPRPVCIGRNSRQAFAQRLREGRKLGKPAAVALQRVFVSDENNTLLYSRRARLNLYPPEDGRCITTGQRRDRNNRIVETTMAGMYYTIDGAISMDVKITVALIRGVGSKPKVDLAATNYRCDSSMLDCSRVAYVVFECLLNLGFNPTGAILCNHLGCTQDYDGDVRLLINRTYTSDNVEKTLPENGMMNVERSIFQFRFHAFEESLYWDPELETSSVQQVVDDLDIYVGDEQYKDDERENSCSNVHMSVMTYLLSVFLAISAFSGTP